MRLVGGRWSGREASVPVLPAVGRVHGGHARDEPAKEPVEGLSFTVGEGRDEGFLHGDVRRVDVDRELDPLGRGFENGAAAVVGVGKAPERPRFSSLSMRAVRPPDDTTILFKRSFG